MEDVADKRAEVLMRARVAGLEKAADRFPDELIAAAAAAADARSAFDAPLNPAAEPWPPMRVRSLP